MKWIAVLKCLLIVLVFSGCQEGKIESPPQPPKKKAEFKREVFDADKYPGLTAVGKIKILETKWCSMTLVSEDIGITAGHCFLKSSTKFNHLGFTEVVFRAKDGNQIKGIKIERVLKRKMNPDFAIVKLNKKIPSSMIKPLEISSLEYADMLGKSDQLGCAGFNGDKELGKKGELLTISRNIKIFHETNKSDRIDTNCVSTNGGSGGLFFEEKYNSVTKTNDFYFVGVIWGVVGDNFNNKGEKINDRDMITSITPVKVFYEDLKEIINEN